MNGRPHIKSGLPFIGEEVILAGKAGIGKVIFGLHIHR
jgi:hypothetical protein